MEKVLEREIAAEAKRRLQRHEARFIFRQKYIQRVKKRTTKTPTISAISRPKVWDFHRQFDPAYCLRHARFLARSIVHAVRSNSYAPICSYRFGFRKASGSYRYVDVFGIPDAALAKLLSQSIRERNQKIFSATSFAYMTDKTALDAVYKIKSYISSDKVFVSQYDFESYFDKIDREFIKGNVLESGEFLLTSFEKTVLRSILQHKFQLQGNIGERQRGIPQGNALSLFLANAVGHSLDKSLDKLSGNYVRYADDSVLINYSYEDAIAAISAFREFSRNTSVEMHPQKSTGISLFARDTEEMRTVRHIDFLGYRFSSQGVRLSSASIRRMKDRCAQIIYETLLLYPRKYKTLNCRRLDGNKLDWDLVSCLHRLRSYINGPYNNYELHEFLNGRRRIKVLSGSVSYYCLTDDITDFRMLDGWLIWALERALKERAKLIVDYCKAEWKTPTKRELIDGTWFDRSHHQFDVTAPSFVLAWRASRKCWLQHGTMGVQAEGDMYEYQ